MNKLYKIKDFIDRIIAHVTDRLFLTVLEYSIAIMMIAGYYAVAVPMMFMISGFYTYIGLAMYCTPIILVSIGWGICEYVNYKELKKTKE